MKGFEPAAAAARILATLAISYALGYIGTLFWN